MRHEGLSGPRALYDAYFLCMGSRQGLTSHAVSNFVSGVDFAGCKWLEAMLFGGVFEHPGNLRRGSDDAQR